jgi:hypothetical protein
MGSEGACTCWSGVHVCPSYAWERTCSCNAILLQGHPHVTTSSAYAGCKDPHSLFGYFGELNPQNWKPDWLYWGNLGEGCVVCSRLERE